MYRDERDNFSQNEDHHDNQTRFHGMVERENINFTRNRVMSKKTYEVGIPSVMINVDHTEADEGK